MKIEINSRKKIEKQLKHLAQHDLLTGLPNWRLFEELSCMALIQAKRYEYEEAVLFLDVDGFKEINDSLGHKAGDELLKQIAARIKGSVREADIVARIGGDEFCIHLCSQSSVTDIKSISSKIISCISSPFMLELSEVKIGISIGVARFPTDADNTESLLAQADKAMYKAKQSGKNRFRFYSLD